MVSQTLAVVVVVVVVVVVAAVLSTSLSGLPGTGITSGRVWGEGEDII